ncbi:hypothetical protein EMCRGX_G017427 [Ephydatia muelleri]
MLRVQQRPASEESEHNLDAVVREDLLRLQREYRVTEGKRKFTSDQAQNAIRKQSAVIDTLQEENENLKKDLALAGSKQNESKDQHVASTLQELIQKQAAYQERIAQEEKTIEQLEKQINEIRKSVGKQRKEMGGSNMSHHQHVTLQKHLKVMENRLDKATVRFNSSLAGNADLRQQIDHLRQERKVFEGIQRRHQRELADCKQRMGEIIEMSTLAYEARDEAQSKMLALKEKADKELTQYSTELKELIRVIDHDRKLKEFMRRKDHERTEAHEEMEMTRRKREADKATEREETVMSYEVAFEKIKAATGITDIDQLVHKFIEVEDQNFALFNYVNELNGDIELVQEQIQEIKEEIERFKSQGTEMEEKRKAILRQLEDELDSINEQTALFERQYSSSTKVLDQLKSGTDSLFSKIGCDSTTITDMLGGHAGVTETTILQYLGIIEQRTNELLQIQAFIQAKESDDPQALARFLMGYASQGKLAASSLVLPSVGDEEEHSDTEDEGKPLDQDELRARALKGITRRETKKATPTSTHNQPPSTSHSSSKPKGTADRKQRGLATS